MAEKRISKDEKEQAIAHGNDVLTDQKLERSLNENTDKPVGLEIIAELAMSVDVGTMTMPEARKSLGNWFHEQPNIAQTIIDGRIRMRRFKQISDALYEEFSALAGSQGG